MRVDIDGEPVPCGAFVSSAEVIVVEFNLPPGKHEVCVSSVETDSNGPLPPRRIVYVAREFTVNAK